MIVSFTISDRKTGKVLNKVALETDTCTLSDVIGGNYGIVNKNLGIFFYGDNKIVVDIKEGIKDGD